MLLALTSLAGAAGFTLVDSGVRGQGRAGAFVAGADDYSAQWYNPAALSSTRGTSVKFDLWATQQTVEFDRADIPGVNPFQTVQSMAPPVLEPAGGVVTRLGGLHPALANTTLAVGVLVPTGSDYSWPAAGAQRYAIIDSAIRQLYAGPTVAQRINPWLSVGAGIQYTLLRVDQSLVATLCNSADPDACGSDTPTDDVVLDIAATDPFALTWNAGLLVTPIPAVALGLSVQPGVSFDAAGATTATLSEDNGTVRPYLTDASFTDPDATLAVQLPWTVRAGVQVTPTATVRVELAGTWTGWADTDALVVTDLDLTLTGTEDGPLQGRDIVVTDDVSLRTGFVDTWSLRLGGEWDADPALTVRAGVFGETSATPDAMANPGVPDSDKGGAAAGLTVRLGRHLSLDASGMVTGWMERAVTTSVYAQPALYVDYGDSFRTTVGEGRVIGNGTYRSSAWIGGLGVGWQFGGPDGR
ncbi:MAG: hypothetical protein EXR71_14815 [Myxococcales bacterium]|nr:hypothetical protein [Myxococcales bacterium]